MRYIDFDGVILDTDSLLFEEWRKNPDRHLLSEKVKIEYIKRANWKYIVENSPIINDSIYILRNMDLNENAILTTVHSIENEAQEKILYLRKNGVKLQIIVVPYTIKKNDIVNARGNILIDDSLRNLKYWKNDSGYPMFFDKKEDNYDSWNKYNEDGYQRVLKINERPKC